MRSKNSGKLFSSAVMFSVLFREFCLPAESIAARILNVILSPQRKF